MKITVSILILGALMMSACSRNDHIISDPDYRDLVGSRFEYQKALASHRNDPLFGVFNRDLSPSEKEALEFLYAFMPLSDLADYTGEFYLANVRASLAARDTFSWGKRVPNELFLHFVLPIRVNNENLDTSRMVFFRELTGRVQHLSMKDAILEVNHWCHEKVNYRGTDSRTSSPLATVKTAYGRCGEESTFTVAALRSVGIPARQCYTPRWAHTDDNHAWVEAWADGRWYYIGACEPEPELNMAWFTGPAKRAMMVNTNVFGAYEGPEEVLVQDPRFTRINVLSNYTKVKRLFVQALTADREPCDSAVVEFQLYNYAEFYPLQRVVTGKDGLCSLETGLGDLLIWAANGDRFGFIKADVRKDDTVEVVLDRTSGISGITDLDLVPPVAQDVPDTVPDSLKQVNARRLAAEDRLRNAYTETFIDSARTYRLAVTLRVNPDTLWTVLNNSRGNWQDIVSFIQGAPPGQRSLVFPLLLSISEKDLHDVTRATLDDHLRYSTTYPPLTSEPDIFYQYILNPRFDNEYLKPWKHLFQERFGREFIEKARTNPAIIESWVRDSITVDQNANWGRAPLTPVGVYELRVADPSSRNMFFTALCRSAGIPARIETSTRTPQYYFHGGWNDVWFDGKPESGEARASLTLDNDPANRMTPEYYIQFTIEQYNDGFYRSLDYETDPSLTRFPCTLEERPGPYLLVTGNRQEDGSVLASLHFFSLSADARQTETISLRKVHARPKVYGQVDLRKAFTTPPDQGVIIAFIEPGQEPTRHFTSDLKQKKTEFSQWVGQLLLICPDEESLQAFVRKNGRDLPPNTSFTSRKVFPYAHLGSLARRGAPAPQVYFLNAAGEVIYLSEGYHIGTGDELLNLIRN